MSKSITQLRKWNLVAGGSDPRNDVIPASVGYGLEDALDFAMSEILRLQDRIKRLEEAGQRVEDAAYSIQDWSGTALGDALDELEKAKEAKP